MDRDNKAKPSRRPARAQALLRVKLQQGVQCRGFVWETGRGGGSRGEALRASAGGRGTQQVAALSSPTPSPLTYFLVRVGPVGGAPHFCTVSSGRLLMIPALHPEVRCFLQVAGGARD